MKTVIKKEELNKTVKNEEKKEVLEMLEVLKKLPRNARTQMLYVLQGVALVSNNIEGANKNGK